MGICQSIINYILSKLFDFDRKKICILGPMDSGKTSLTFFFNNKKKVSVIPTIGYNIDEVRYKKKNLVIFDLGQGIFSKWGEFIEDSDYIFFVIDVSSKQSINYAKGLLHQIYFGNRFRVLLKDEKEYQEEKKIGEIYGVEEDYFSDDREIINKNFYQSVIENQSESDRNYSSCSYIDYSESENEVKIF